MTHTFFVCHQNLDYVKKKTMGFRLEYDWLFRLFLSNYALNIIIDSFPRGQNITSCCEKPASCPRMPLSKHYSFSVHAQSLVTRNSESFYLSISFSSRFFFPLPARVFCATTALADSIFLSQIFIHPLMPDCEEERAHEGML